MIVMSKRYLLREPTFKIDQIYITEFIVNRAALKGDSSSSK